MGGEEIFFRAILTRREREREEEFSVVGEMELSCPAIRLGTLQLDAEKKLCQWAVHDHLMQAYVIRNQHRKI